MRTPLRIAAVVSAVVLTAGTSYAWGVTRPSSPNDQRLAAPPAAAAAIAPTTSEESWVALPACTIARVTVAKDKAKDLRVSGTSGFQTQGGRSGGCGVPARATGVSLTLNATRTSSTAAKLKAYALGTTAPATYLATAPSSGIGAGSGPVRLGTGDKIRVTSTSAGASVVAVVTGYSVAPIHAVLGPTGSVYSGSPRVVSSTLLSTGSYQVELDRDPTGCTPIASVNGGAYIASSYVSGQYVYANTYTVSGSPINLYWELTVTC